MRSSKATAVTAPRKECKAMMPEMTPASASRLPRSSLKSSVHILLQERAVHRRQRGVGSVGHVQRGFGEGQGQQILMRPSFLAAYVQDCESCCGAEAPNEHDGSSSAPRRVHPIGTETSQWTNQLRGPTYHHVGGQPKTRVRLGLKFMNFATCLSIFER